MALRSASTSCWRRPSTPRPSPFTNCNTIFPTREVEAPLCDAEASLPEVQRLLAHGLRQRLFSGVQCVGSAHGGILHREAAGSAVLTPPPQILNHEHFFDLQELTMPLATALAAMVLVQTNRLDLQAPVVSALPEFTEAHFAEITMSMLLDHSSGLPAQAPLYPRTARVGRHSPWGSRAVETELKKALRAVPLAAPPGTQTCVSDLGYQLLGWALEARCGGPLDSFLSREVYTPLGLQEQLFFVQKRSKVAMPRHFVATSASRWRHTVVRGEVRDSNAWAQGGVAGHAGLFGSASGVWRLGQTLLLCAQGEPTLFHTGTLKRFWTRSRRFVTQRTLGWEVPTVVGSPAGKRIARTAIGHGSRHGPALWIDPQSNSVFVLLCNGQPGADPRATQTWRDGIFDALSAEAARGVPENSEVDWARWF